ncbi:squalene--hopene cyclase [Aquisphaera insulae]|uniref:squalene--hopene cyclase n=1 Tax=Aquisphaera insulae TaxID=2712864 RepID=UPI00196B98A3|nr:squalene--hopene cyclase [Aquisphaera insulae]
MPVIPTSTRSAIGLGILGTLLVLACPPASAQVGLPGARFGEVIPRDVREMYDRGIQFLASSQNDRGEWPGGSYEEGPAPVGLGMLVFLASGEDPNFGLYSNHIRRSLRNLITAQDATTGIMGQSMYHHGFATLALAEAYGAVDERNLWPDGKAPRSVGQALELAVRAAITSQKKNSLGGWRYSPDANDADTSVSGAVLVGLLAARNAGIEVPDAAVDRAVAYYKSMTAPSGQVAYSGGMGGFDESIARISIATLIYSVSRRKDMPEYKSTLNYLRGRLEQQAAQQWVEYARYYQAQALFQGDLMAWEKWNNLLVRQLKQAQKPDGSFQGQFGPGLTTSFDLLALALNFRFLPIYER